MTVTKSAGQTFTVELRKLFNIGPRTRWYRKSGYNWGASLTQENVRDRFWESVNFDYDYDRPERKAAFGSARNAMAAWEKHIEGVRIDPSLSLYLRIDLSPWEWTAYLGRMVDTGYTCVGPFEDWFAEQARALRTAA
jgi:hypothetical protein